MRSMEVVSSCFIYISISYPYLSPTQPSQRHQGANADGPTRAPLNADIAESSQAAMPTPPREVRWIRERETQKPRENPSSNLPSFSLLKIMEVANGMSPRLSDYRIGLISTSRITRGKVNDLKLLDDGFYGYFLLNWGVNRGTLQNPQDHWEVI